MTLVDLTRGLFTYLVRFRHQAGRPDAPSLPRVRSELLTRFEEMGDQVRRQPHLAAPYHMVVHALVALADEVLSSSDWEHAGSWAQEPLARDLFGQDQTDSGFFAKLKGLKKPPPDVLAIYYLCLALGFHGHYPPGDPELASLKAELLSSLPSRPSLDTQAAADVGGPPLPRGSVPLSVREVAPGERRRAAAPALSAHQAPSRLPRPRTLGIGALGLLAVAAVWFGLRPATTARPPLNPPAAPASPAPTAKPSLPPPPEQAKAREEIPASASSRQSSPKTSPKAPSEVSPPASVALVVAAASASREPRVEASSPPPDAREKKAEAPAPAPMNDAPPAAKTEGEFAVQAGLFVGPIQSGRLAEGIRKLGLPAYVIQREVGGKTRFMVLAGPFSERETAMAALEPMRAKLGIQAYITDPQEPGKRLP